VALNILSRTGEFGCSTTHGSGDKCPFVSH
jgi:hypothetical protein